MYDVHEAQKDQSLWFWPTKSREDLRVSDCDMGGAVLFHPMPYSNWGPAPARSFQVFDSRNVFISCNGCLGQKAWVTW